MDTPTAQIYNVIMRIVYGERTEYSETLKSSNVIEVARDVSRKKAKVRNWLAS